MNDGPMNEHQAIQRLDRLGGLVDVGGAPIERVRAAGQRAAARRRRLQIGGIVASVAVAAVGASVVARQTPASTPTPPSAISSSPTTTADTASSDEPTDGSFDQYRGAVPTEAQLWGTWRPVRIGDGPRIDGVRRSGGSPLLLEFISLNSAPRTAWNAYDGCNWTSGRVRLSDRSFSTARNSSTLRGCLTDFEVFKPSIPDVVERSARLTIYHGRLRFYDSDLRLLAVFAPTDVSMY